MRRAIVFVVLLLVSSFASGQVLVVNIYDPMPGQLPQSIQYAQEAKAIHQKLGGSPSVRTDQMGRMHYVMPFESWSAWAAFQAKVQGSRDWTAFMEKINAKPSAKQWASLRMDVVVPGEIGDVAEVFIWEPIDGRINEAIGTATAAKAIHEKAGAKVSVNVDRLNRVHYVMSFDNLEAWAKFQDTPNEEFSKFMEKYYQNPPAKLVENYAVNSVD